MSYDVTNPKNDKERRQAIKDLKDMITIAERLKKLFK